MTITPYALAAKAWPFEEARRIIERLGNKKPAKGYVLFETGYGPSGLPHIGTFGEVVRTTMVRQAFQCLSDIPTRLFAFSDDMDGLRKVPTNIPNREIVAQHLGKPLTSIPDPFQKYESFGHHNNARLRSFLDSFGFEYEFQSATDWYKSGRFDKALLAVLAKYQEIMDIMLPSLREERQQTYSPFLPLCQKTGRVLQVPVLEHDVKAGTIIYQSEDGEKVETPVTGGRCKLQWKPDWAMRWHALHVDYEMSGKDLIPSVKLATDICQVLGSIPPVSLSYELFLDENGEKISKSRGNGLSVEEWLSYAPPESLALYMYQKPRTAKRLYFDVIPKAVDEYLDFSEKFPTEPAAAQLENPVWHIHNGQAPKQGVTLHFSILLNLVNVCNTEDKQVLWGFISRYAQGATPHTAPFLDKLIGYAIAYYRDRVKPHKKYRLATDMEKAAITDLRLSLEGLTKGATSEQIQTSFYDVGKRHAFPDLRAWFKILYEILLGQEQGPRWGTFVAIYGLSETIKLLRQAENGQKIG
ncbi:MAG: lysine--tRNA ligase [Alphaproteobacteria bacterium]|nr:lysine--tRNA ligase [Alphaproteobacteria bacterium]